MPWRNPNFDKITNIFRLLLKIVPKQFFVGTTIPKDNFKTHFETLKRCIISKKANLSKNIFYFSQIFTEVKVFGKIIASVGTIWHLITFKNPLEIRLFFQIRYGNIVAYDGIQTIFFSYFPKIFLKI